MRLLPLSICHKKKLCFFPLGMKTKQQVLLQKRESLLITLKIINLYEKEFDEKLGRRGKEAYIDDILDQINLINEKLKRINEKGK